jgi:hypothetical protein
MVAYYSLGMRTISFKLPNQVIERLEQECRKRGVSKSEFIRESLDIHFKAANKSRQPSCLDLIQDLVGSAKNAPRDLATNPKYMQGYGE